MRLAILISVFLKMNVREERKVNQKAKKNGEREQLCCA